MSVAAPGCVVNGPSFPCEKTSVPSVSFFPMSRCNSHPPNVKLLKPVCGITVSPTPPYVVHGPQLFCTHTGSFHQTFPSPNPFAEAPVGTSIIVNVPIIGLYFVSFTERNFTPISVSPTPHARPPTPAPEYRGLLYGKIAAAGNTIWNCVLGKMPQLNSSAGPTVSISTPVASMDPNV